ncbi:expressed unknown protein [Seminavis robusta]|uniref:Calmodulin n=1 Tax=Seminavis robusta TaxID=568900 RepID=A0A9N8ESU4_9STRA|nr:expressed unknown protein [Seminavis robusta]|eukprot:Sro1584_g284020.1 n/a (1494) ;mRNA; r:3393-8082
MLPWRKTLMLTAYATALEAIVTDLLELVPQAAVTSCTNSHYCTVVFYCGNFGLILLNPLWQSNDCEAALHMLQKMIQVTMIRGAQAGGVVTFEQPASNPNATRAIRSRVVNRKRTDLSEGIIAKVKRDYKINNRPYFWQSSSKQNNNTADMVKLFAGHTRFATSSISNLDGTHPHRWSPTATRRVYDFLTAQANNVQVENHIMHNGDFEFYELNGMSYDLEIVQDFLADVLCEPMPSTTDSCAIAGFLDLIRTQGCFSLSARYALAVGMPCSSMESNSTFDLPRSFDFYEQVGAIFEACLEKYLSSSSSSSRVEALQALARDKRLRQGLIKVICTALPAHQHLFQPMVPFHISEFTKENEQEDVELGNQDPKSVYRFVSAAVHAFFDNDLMQSTKEFLSNARGSFGLCVVSTLDAKSQMCLAAQGQTISVAFYPKSGLVLYGSEQAAVKAAMNVDAPGHGNVADDARAAADDDDKDVDNALDRLAARLDLDDLAGEICLLDWSTNRGNDDQIVSRPNRHLMVHNIMNQTLRVVLCKLNQTTGSSNINGMDKSLFHRMTLLEGNDFIQPLRKDPEDIVLSDIQSIPRVCQAIQKNWQNETADISFNRLTALALSRSLIRRLDAISSGRLQQQPGSVDILLTGCEVSLWLAEQMASDLKKALTKLNVLAVSSNKVLGLFGQEQSIPAIGFPMSPQTHVLSDTIVIILSHSGGTFGPLQCSNLLQSVTRNIFAVTSEWDCQIGKQLRSMYDPDNETIADSSRLFTTGVGLAPAEPCSLSVAAMQQLLTQIFVHICIVGTSSPRHRHILGAVITERDLQILERCNRDNIQALEEIVGVDAEGKRLKTALTQTVRDLRAIGDRWSEHVLENAKAYIMSFLYIVITVTTGWPLISGIGHAAGAGNSEWLVYILRFLDSLLYFWLPQINITILRLLQGRDLLHRMVGRTVVIGDIPWVAASAEAFLSKLFACSYSIAGLNVHSANPSDHLVHRHTHRVTRGTLLVCGRPDGRLMALSSLENSVLLSVNQASSIQSWGGRCESVTIGHNPFENGLCYKNIFLARHRPLFLCERILDMTASPALIIPPESEQTSALAKLATKIPGLTRKNIHISESTMDSSASSSSSANNSKSRPTRDAMKKSVSMSSSALMGRYSTLKMQHKVSMTRLRNRMLREAHERELLNRSRHKEWDLLLQGHKKIHHGSHHGNNAFRNWLDSSIRSHHKNGHGLDSSMRSRDSSTHRRAHPNAHGVPATNHHAMEVNDILAEMHLEQTEVAVAQRVFEDYDENNNGGLDLKEFLAAYKFIDPALSTDEATRLFEEADLNDSGELSFNEFLRVLTTPQLKLQAAKNRSIRDHVGLVSVKPTEGKFFDADIYNKEIAGVSKIALAKSESLSMELYEARIASLQRFVSMCVMFHQLGHRVQSFFSTISFGLWGYRMDRTHSIMRVATTASPASGANVRRQMEVLRMFHVLNRAAHTIGAAWARYKQRKVQRLLELDSPR